jgi:uncharacterized protein with beta-barrel porin domain
MRGGWQIVPNVGLLHSTWKMDDFSEAGAAGANTTFSDWSDRSLRSRAGVEVAHRSAGSRLAPRASLVWWHEFNQRHSFGARIAGANGTYNAPGRAEEKNLVQGSIAIDARIRDHAVFSVGVEGVWGSNLRAGPGFSAGISFGF